MKRRIIAQGAGGYTITLPKKWIQENNLHSGAEIEVQEEAGGLIITAKAQKTEKKLELDLSSYDSKMITNLLCQAYRLGYGSISLHYRQEQFPLIQKLALNSLLGLEIVENKNQHCLLQNIAEPEIERFPVILRRLFLQVLEVSEICYSQSVERKYSLSPLHDLKLQIDKMTNYTRRTIIRDKQGGEKQVLLYSILNHLSLISHDYGYLLEFLAKNKIFLSKKTLEMLLQANQMLRKFYESFYQADKLGMHEIGKKKEVFFRGSEEWLMSLRGKEATEAVALSYLREIVRLIQASTTYSLGYNL